jgi:membrane protease YdiL (CAAX protease family)
VALEIAYLYMRTKLIGIPEFVHMSVIAQEIVRCIPRAVILACMLLVLWRFNSFPEISFNFRVNRTVAFLIVVLMAESYLFFVHPKVELVEHLTFGVTTILVAVREELEYRYVLQNWLLQRVAPKFNIVVSLLMTAIVFTLSHLGAQSIGSFPGIFFASVLLGCIYHFSGKNITTVIICHFLADMFGI